MVEVDDAEDEKELSRMDSIVQDYIERNDGVVLDAYNEICALRRACVECKYYGGAEYYSALEYHMERRFGIEVDDIPF